MKSTPSSIIIGKNSQGVPKNDSPFVEPLFIAVEKGHIAGICVLVELGADVSAVDNLGRTPAHIAGQHGQVEAIRVLATLDADVKAAANKGATPVFMAAENGHVEAIRALVELGADVTAVDNYGRTPVWIAARHGHVDAIRVLAELGADVKAANESGATPVYAAACGGHVEAIRVLAKLGVNVKLADNVGYTPVYHAAVRGHVEAIRALAELGADVSAVTIFGSTPFDVSVRRGHVEAIRVLAELGADVNLPDQHGRTPVYMAARRGHLKAIRVIRLLAELGADVSAARRDGVTPVYIAAEYGHVNAIRVLAELGANVRAADIYGETPVYQAAHYGQVEAIRVLAELGADVRAARNDGFTPAYIAARRGHVEAARVLAELLGSSQRGEKRVQDILRLALIAKHFKEKDVSCGLLYKEEMQRFLQIFNRSTAPENQTSLENISKRMVGFTNRFLRVETEEEKDKDNITVRSVFGPSKLWQSLVGVLQEYAQENDRSLTRQHVQYLLASSTSTRRLDRGLRDILELLKRESHIKVLSPGAVVDEELKKRVVISNTFRMLPGRAFTNVLQFLYRASYNPCPFSEKRFLRIYNRQLESILPRHHSLFGLFDQEIQSVETEDGYVRVNTFEVENKESAIALSAPIADQKGIGSIRELCRHLLLYRPYQLPAIFCQKKVVLSVHDDLSLTASHSGVDLNFWKALIEALREFRSISTDHNQEIESYVRMLAEDSKAPDMKRTFRYIINKAEYENKKEDRPGLTRSPLYLK